MIDIVEFGLDVLKTEETSHRALVELAHWLICAFQISYGGSVRWCIAWAIARHSFGSLTVSSFCLRSKNFRSRDISPREAHDANFWDALDLSTWYREADQELKWDGGTSLRKPFYL
jgi:hypothetical protein